jgi:uncharacterized protein YciI
MAQLSQEETLAAVFGAGEGTSGRMGNTGTPAAVKVQITADIVAQGILLTAGGPLAHTGTTAGFLGATPVARPASLTAVNAAAVGATYTATEQGVITNLRTRLNELETKLRDLGLLT